MITQGVILAAGSAERMAQLGMAYPKPLLPAGGESILAFQIREMAKLGVRIVYIVHGGDAEKLKNAYRATAPGDMQIRFVEQREPAGIGNALLLLAADLTGVFAVFLGDIYYETGDIRHISHLLGAGKTLLLARKSASAGDISKNFSVQSQDGRVMKVMEKPQTVTADMHQGCGIYFFNPQIFSALTHTAVSPLRSERELTDGIQTLIDSGSVVRCAEILDYEMNVNTPLDLYKLNMYLIRKAGMVNFIQPHVQLDTSAAVSASVICAHVTVSADCVIDQSIVLDHTFVPAGTNAKNCILGPDFRLAFDEN